MSQSALISILVLAGCSYHSEMEGRYAGTVPLRIANAYSSALCELYIVEAGAAQWGASWIRGQDTMFDKGTVDAGATKDFKVRAGKYQLRYQGCAAAASAMGADGTVVAVAETGPAYHGQLEVFDVGEPVEVVLHPPGTRATKTMPSYTLVDAHGSETRTPADAWHSGSGDCELECTHPAEGAEHEQCMQRCERRSPR